MSVTAGQTPTGRSRVRGNGMSSDPNVDQAAHIDVCCLIPLELSCQQPLLVRLTGSPCYAFGSGATVARALGVRAGVRSALRRNVGAALVAPDDLGQFFLVERP